MNEKVTDSTKNTTLHSLRRYALHAVKTEGIQ